MPQVGLRIVSLLVLCVMALNARSAMAADWFVAPADSPGDGTRQKPFSDLWRALAIASSGDSIHIAQGTYYGRYDRSAWVIDRPKLTLLGGYNREFTTRDPWKQPSVLAFFAGYQGPSENNVLSGLDNHTGVVIDGLVIDGAGRNRYVDKAPFPLAGGLQMVTSLISFDSEDVVIRNCVLLNSSTGAADLRGAGTIFENNIVINHFSHAMLVLRDKPGSNKKPITIRNNTFAFAYDDTDPLMGKGGEKGVAIRVGAPAEIEDNVFIGCGNAALNLFTKADGVAINRNTFWLPMRANIAERRDGRELVIANKNLEEMEDLGFKSGAENKAVDPGLVGLKPEWIDGVSRQMLFSYATPPKEAMAALRTRYGLGEAIKPVNDNDRGPVAPRLEVADACAVQMENGSGAKSVELPVKLAPASAAEAVPVYARLSWADFVAGAASLEGKHVELVAALGNERNTFAKPGMSNEKYIGFEILYPAGDSGPDRAHVYAVRNAAAHRQWQDGNKSNNAVHAEDFYLIRGIARLTGARQKATIEVQSVLPGEAPPKAATPRPKGREWFIRAGASGGDGTREKPFRDPFQALEKAADGDTLRIATGDYFGKLRIANWKIANKYLSLIGGYDAEFKQRDPWKTPTRLILSPDAEKDDRTKHGGKFLESSEICTGLVLDGLVFDGSTINAYYEGAGAGLNLSLTIMSPLVQLHGADVTIRNCLFANASGAALQLGSASGTFENNIVVNTNGSAVNINAMGSGPWIIRRNTFLFSTDPTTRAGRGQTSAGTHLNLTGRAAARIEGNIFGFADNNGIRVTLPNEKVTIEKNAFGGNMAYPLTDVRRTWLFDAVWQRRLDDAGFASTRDNVITLPAGLAIDKEFVNWTLPRLFELRGRYSNEQWAAIAAGVGATVTPAAEAPAPVVEPPKEEKKEQSIEDLMGELNKLKAEVAKPANAPAPKGPPYCPAYPWRAALDLAGDPKTTTVGASRVEIRAD